MPRRQWPFICCFCSPARAALAPCTLGRLLDLTSTALSPHPYPHPLTCFRILALMCPPPPHPTPPSACSRFNATQASLAENAWWSGCLCSSYTYRLPAGDRAAFVHLHHLPARQAAPTSIAAATHELPTPPGSAPPRRGPPLPQALTATPSGPAPPSPPPRSATGATTAATATPRPRRRPTASAMPSRPASRWGGWGSRGGTMGICENRCCLTPGPCCPALAPPAPPSLALHPVALAAAGGVQGIRPRCEICPGQPPVAALGTAAAWHAHLGHSSGLAWLPPPRPSLPLCR